MTCSKWWQSDIENWYRPQRYPNVIGSQEKGKANRLKDSLPSLIGPYQSSFIKGRSIIDNIIIAQEMVHSMRRKKGASGWMAIKVDLEKDLTA